jgi:hypothetical protein
MLVKFNNSIPNTITENWDEKEKKRYSYEKHSLLKDQLYVVYGILLTNIANLYILAPDQPNPVIGLYNSVHFDVVSNNSSRYWKVFLEINNLNLAYENVDFSNVDYIGIDRLVSEPNFFEKLFDGGTEETSYLRHMSTLLRTENISG